MIIKTQWAFIIIDLQITNNFKILLITNTKKLLQKLEENKNDWTYHDDHSIYTGSAGIANMFQLYADYFNEPVYYSVCYIL